MTRTIHLDANIHVAPQLVADDFAMIAAAGFRSVVCNRPDGEAEDQLPSGTAQKLAERAGLEFRYQPVAGYETSEDDVVHMFSDLAAKLPGPILFYCRTGTRCTLLWAQSAAPGLGTDTVTRIAAAAGYDLTPIAEILADRESQAAAMAA
ncbi:MAG: TIGR01244 family sulfur transferase [Nitratireductor sp.]